MDYEAHLETINEALKQDPDNAELLQLRKDIIEVIELEKESKNVTSSNDGEIDDLSVVSKPPITSVPDEVNCKKYVGRICSVIYQGKPTYSKIIAATNDKLTLDLFGLEKQATATISEIRLLEAPNQSQCKPGTKLQALYQPDGLWYNCTIDKITPLGYYITYCDYDTSELVGFDQVRIPTNQQLHKNGVKEIITPAGYRIPENLIVKDTDTEKQRMKKRKIVSSLKKKQKQESIDKEIESRVNSWRNFQQKVKPRI
ncbi:survival motor neuron-like protein (SMN) [Babesia microti strain RI]|uniref:Survival motor neuron-like protein (SMN) n=1 Tax=Babesia microti (strain RI) TaxID=1133968 RepID=I7IH89_BABMR|nr:survival motor neuron-like protein (SMN) [Babesia microti strain RI]CCF75392.1 survival motor neuron-like protein (SMN) [Babesia microti strain RI]|eukprot:XP_012649800.1 survival motor neuron-like protein (SMN) [Babesia microti strain RI]